MATKRERSINLSQSEISILTELFDKNEDALKEKQGYLITKNAKWTEVTEMINEVGIQRCTGDQARDLEVTTGATIKMSIRDEGDFVVSEGQSKATTYVATQTEAQHIITNSKMCRVCGEGELTTRTGTITGLKRSGEICEIDVNKAKMRETVRVIKVPWP
uniref:Uncharacterized protein n=1 Tax=Magallana gigas TaxID=29159 RepID=A0A8W8MEB2_MAGGI